MKGNLELCWVLWWASLSLLSYSFVFCGIPESHLKVCIPCCLLLALNRQCLCTLQQMPLFIVRVFHTHLKPSIGSQNAVTASSHICLYVEVVDFPEEFVVLHPGVPCVVCIVLHCAFCVLHLFKKLVLYQILKCPLGLPISILLAIVM